MRPDCLPGGFDPAEIASPGNAVVPPNDGGPAYPSEIGFGHGSDNMHQTGASVAQWYGMTLRDHLAGLSMAAQIGTAAAPCMGGWDGYQDHIAKAAYQMADAMIKARGTAT